MFSSSSLSIYLIFETCKQWAYDKTFVSNGKTVLIISRGNYRPQRSWAKVMFLQASVILSTEEGVCLSASVQAGILLPPQEQTPPIADPTEQTPPKADTPQSRHPPGADPPEQTPPPQEQTPPGADTPPEQTLPGPDTPWHQVDPPNQVHPPPRSKYTLGLSTLPRTKYTPRD